VQDNNQRVRLVETGKSPRKGKIGATRMFILEMGKGERRGRRSNDIPLVQLLDRKRKKSKEKKSRRKI
jgi:hypothetical protein